MRGELATLTHEGCTHERWQHELPGGTRIWFYVDDGTVHLVDVFTAHPNRTTCLQRQRRGREGCVA